MVGPATATVAAPYNAGGGSFTSTAAVMVFANHANGGRAATAEPTAWQRWRRWCGRGMGTAARGRRRRKYGGGSSRAATATVAEFNALGGTIIIRPRIIIRRLPPAHSAANQANGGAGGDGGQAGPVSKGGTGRPPRHRRARRRWRRWRRRAKRSRARGTAGGLANAGTAAFTGVTGISGPTRLMAEPAVTEMPAASAVAAAGERQDSRRHRRPRARRRRWRRRQRRRWPGRRNLERPDRGTHHRPQARREEGLQAIQGRRYHHLESGESWGGSVRRRRCTPDRCGSPGRFTGGTASSPSPGRAGHLRCAGTGIGGGLYRFASGNVTIANTNVTGNNASTAGNDVSVVDAVER